MKYYRLCPTEGLLKIIHQIILFLAVLFTIDLDSCIVIIRNVPSQVCTQCGETYYSTEVMQQLYKIADSVRNSMTEIAVINYHSAA